MLTELWISNLAVVERLEARFAAGLNVLTGETGAGKSLIVGSVELVLGGRSSAGLVRKGEREAEIVARFELPADHFTRRGIDLPLDDGELVLRRTVGVDGRSRAYVNDRPATVGRLRELGAAIADLHGQHEQQNLLREDTHLRYLDAYADAGEILATVEAAFLAFREAQDRRDAFRERRRRSARERDLLRYQFEELERAVLAEGEEEELGRERHRGLHAGRLAEEAARALEALSEGEANAESLLAAASRYLGAAAEHDAALEPVRRQVDEALVAAAEAARDLTHYADGLQTDPARMEEVEARLALLAGLRRKYHGTAGELIARREELRAQLDDPEDAPRRLEELEAAWARTGEELAARAAELSAVRSRAGASFARAVARELKGLGMDAARFSVELRPPRAGATLPGRDRPVTARGAEEASFVLAPNPGETAGPLNRIASGGEISRVMLALKNVLRRVDEVPLAVFDEVDAGIGGLVAEAVAKRLATLAAGRQVLVVTHLPVIAGKAAHHQRLVKRTDGKRTRIGIETLEGTEREEELARMLAGSVGGEDARRTARAILGEDGPR